MIFDKVKEILMDQLDVEEEKVTMEASIVDDLGADSLDLVDMVMSLEENSTSKSPTTRSRTSRPSATSSNISRTTRSNCPTESRPFR